MAESADRGAAQDVDTHAQLQVLEEGGGYDIAGVNVDDVPAVSVQWSDCVLITKHTGDAIGEVEQRADVGIGLPVIVAERAFVVAGQAGNTPVGAQHPVVGERLVEFEFHRLVDVANLREAVG